MKSRSGPEAVELTLLRFIEDQLVERAIVSEIAHLTMKSGAQQTMALGIGGDLAGVVQEHAATFRDIKAIRKQRTETRERILIACPRTGVRRYQQQRIGFRVR
jgi:hypothetical protein